jgi:hypothetical protein
MKTAIRTTLAAAGTLALATPALAEDMSIRSEAAAEANASYSDEQVRQFAAAAVEVDRIAKDPTESFESKKPKIVAAIEQQGLDVDTFNSIARASKTDSGLRQKISAAISARS